MIIVVYAFQTVSVEFLVSKNQQIKKSNYNMFQQNVNGPFIMSYDYINCDHVTCCQSSDCYKYPPVALQSCHEWSCLQTPSAGWDLPPWPF